MSGFGVGLRRLGLSLKSYWESTKKRALEGVKN